MAKAKVEKVEKSGRKNGALVFEKLGKDFEIPKRVRSGMYDEVLEQLSKTNEVVVIYRAGPLARSANSRRKGLLTAAEAKGLSIHASVRNIEGDNVLLAQKAGDVVE